MSIEHELATGVRDHVIGPESAAVTLVEYADFQCPHCAAAYPVVKSIVNRLGADVRFVFRHFPLWEVHPQALMAAEAAEAAGAQGAFWEMHARLFDNQADLSDLSLFRYAIAAVPNPSRWISDMQLHRHRAKVQADRASGERAGISGTPTFFINGQRYLGALRELPLVVALKASTSRGALSA